MTELPRHDRFSLPCELPDEPSPAAPAVPSEDWRARGLAHPAGRGWVSDCPDHRRDGEESMGTADWTVFTPERQSAFLAQLAECGNVRLAARAAGVSPQTAYRARRNSAALAAAWDAACLAARPIAEAALEDRAMNGWEEPVFFRGERVDTRRRFDTRLLLAHLARLDRIAARVGETGGVRDAMASLDRAIEGLARGEPLPDEAPAKLTQDSVPCVPSSSVEEAREVARLQAHGAEPEEPCLECGGWCETAHAVLTPADCRWLGHRLSRMLRERPADWRRADVDYPDDIDEIHADALEMGLPDWWLLTDEDALEEAMEAHACRGAAGEGLEHGLPLDQLPRFLEAEARPLAHQLDRLDLAARRDGVADVGLGERGGLFDHGGDGGAALPLDHVAPATKRSHEEDQQEERSGDEDPERDEHRPARN